jgi:hypothetical protein
MSANEYMEQFSPHLFWDVRKEDIDLDAHAQYVIQRVLEYGLLGDWNLIKSYYGLPKILLKKQKKLKKNTSKSKKKSIILMQNIN